VNTSAYVNLPRAAAIDSPGTLEMEFQNQVPAGSEDLQNPHSVVQLSGGTREGIDRVEKRLGNLVAEVRVLRIRVEETLVAGGGMVTSEDTSVYVGC